MLKLQSIYYFINHHSTLIYWLGFLIALTESLALIGLIIPGTLIMFLLGALAATTNLSLKLIIVLAILGAIVGDGVSYWIGYHYQDRLKAHWPFSRYPKTLNRGEIFFKKHGGKSVFLGRFLGPIRPIIPVTAGMFGLPPINFIVVNVLSAIGWAFVHILPGFFFGASLLIAKAVSSRLALLFIFTFFVIWFFIWIIRKSFLFIAIIGPKWLNKLETWITQSKPKSIFSRYLKQFLSFIFVRPKGEQLLFVFLIFLFLLTIWGFLGVLQDVFAGELLLIDQNVFYFFQSLRTPWSDDIMLAFTELGDSVVAVSVTLLVFFILLLKRCFQTATYWIFAILGGFLFVNFLKWLLHLPRPISLYSGISAYGFPSSHASMSIIIYGFLAILIAKGLTRTFRWILFASILLFSFFIMLSRLYLGAHWLSDVMGGFLFGLFWTSLVGIIYLKKSTEVPPKKLLAVITILGVLCVGGFNIYQHHKKDELIYTTPHPIKTIPFNQWINGAWEQLPIQRIDMEGEFEQPLTIQFAGDINQLSGYLLSEGWQYPAPLNLKNMLALLSPSTPIKQIPLFPLLHDGRIEKLDLIRQSGEQRWVLRLWDTDSKITIAKMEYPLYIGTIEIQARHNLAYLFTIASDIRNYDAPILFLQQTLQKRFKVKIVKQNYTNIQTDHPINWTGQVILIITTNDKIFRRLK